MRNPAYWRKRRIMYGNLEAWEEVLRRDRENNPHLSLSVLASQNLTEEQVKDIHDRLEAGEMVEVV